MKPCKYTTVAGAERYAAKLSAIFPKRQFKAIQHQTEFCYTVGVYNDGQRVAYAGKCKSADIGRNVTTKREGTE